MLVKSTKRMNKWIRMVYYVEKEGRGKDKKSKQHAQSH